MLIPLRLCLHYADGLPSHLVIEAAREVTDPDTQTTETQAVTREVSFEEFATAHKLEFPNQPKPDKATYGDRQLAAARRALRMKILQEANP